MARSQVMANHLFGLQTLAHSEGLLCVLRCELGAQHAIAITKLELERGVRAELQTSATGQQHFVIEVILT